MTCTNKEIFTRANGVGDCQAGREVLRSECVFLCVGVMKADIPLGFRPLCLDVFLQRRLL